MENNLSSSRSSGGGKATTTLKAPPVSFALSDTYSPGASLEATKSSSQVMAPPIKIKQGSRESNSVKWGPKSHGRPSPTTPIGPSWTL